MTQLNSKAIKLILQEALSKGEDFLKEVVKDIRLPLMEEEREQRVGRLLLAKPQGREFAFKAPLFENYQRNEKALLATICQMVTEGGVSPTG